MSTDAKTKKSRLADLGPGKTVLMPDIYATEFTVEEPSLEIADQLSPETDKADGFNPYDTAVLYKK